jgi:hypothetical protein
LFPPATIFNGSIFNGSILELKTMVQVTSNLRSTAAITTYVQLSDESATIAARLKAITQEMKAIEPLVLEQIGDGRAVKVGSQVRTVKPGQVESIKRTCDDPTAVEWCKSHGLKFQQRSPEYVAPATFSNHVKQGAMDQELYEIETTTIVVVI